MSSLNDLKAATDLAGVAELLKYKSSSLSYILYKKGMVSNYNKFEIKKRYGGTRQISAPSPELKLLQKRLSKLLQDCSAEIVGARSLSDKVAHGFKRGRSIITNAKAHRRHRHVFNLDLEDFFATINFGRVRGFLIKDKDFSLNPKVATVLAQIACYENALPQGSPCSPVISNLIGNVLDIHLVKLALRNGCTYTRYADDLTFSTNKKSFPSEIARTIGPDGHIWAPGQELARRIKRSGFKINHAKTRMQYRDSRQEVTGLIVNRKVNVRREYRHVVRAMVHSLFTTGSFEFRTKTLDKDGNVTVVTSPGTNTQLRGMLGFIDGLDILNEESNPAKFKLPGQDKLTSKESIYLRFLLYSEFYAAPTPVLLCEGKTDNIYLLHAIRSLASKYPQLAQIAPGGKIKLQIRIFKYADKSTGRILRLRGGTSNLANFISLYHSEIVRFKPVATQHPVLVVIDNDAGAGPVHGVIKNITKTQVTRQEPFIHVTGNLYVIATPLASGGAQTKIEDCFDTSTTSTILNGKKFAPENNFETATHYSKAMFARQVVRAQAATIDFGGFSALLNNIVAVLEDFAKPKQ